MAWDGLVQQTGNYLSIRHMEYPKFQTGIFGRMESALYNNLLLTEREGRAGEYWPEVVAYTNDRGPI